jgi:hypothetical protein
MTAHWIREITSVASGASSGFPFASKALAMFLRFVCGYVNPDQVVDRIGVGHSISATVESPPGTFKSTLTDSQGEFVAADVGRTITITNSLYNDGVFGITDYVGTTSIKFNRGVASLAETSAFDWEITMPAQDYWSYEKNGVNGSINLTGTDKNFQDSAAASFVVGDSGKWLLIRDLTNPRNSGWYQVAYVNASTVTLDFRSAVAEYPTQNLGANLSWWLMGAIYQLPDRDGAWWRLESPHANGWALEMWYAIQGTDQGFQIRVAADGNWSGSELLETVYVGVDDGDEAWFYCVADDGGEYINLFFHNSTSSEYGGFLISNVLLSEPGRAANEQVALMGCQSSLASTWSGSSTYERVNDNTCLAWGYMRNAVVGVSRIVKMLEASYLGSTEGFATWTSRTVNSRKGSWDCIEGQPIITDNDNATALGEYEIIGRLQGIYLTSRQATVRAAYNDDATRDRFHVYHGHSIAWPGVTQQH